MRGKKVLMIASSGGHLDELMALDALKKHYETIIVTEKTEYSVAFWQDRVYLLPQVNRRNLISMILFVGTIFRQLFLFYKERPDVILSTGAMIASPMLLIGKLAGKKTIFIECLFNVDASTMTGKFAYRFADLFLVQWEEMLSVYPNAIYGGRVF